MSALCLIKLLYFRVRQCQGLFAHLKSILQFIPKHVDLPKPGLFIDPPPNCRFPVIFRDLSQSSSEKMSKVNKN